LNVQVFFLPIFGTHCNLLLFIMLFRSYSYTQWTCLISVPSPHPSSIPYSSSPPRCCLLSAAHCLMPDMFCPLIDVVRFCTFGLAPDHIHIFKSHRCLLSVCFLFCATTPNCEIAANESSLFELSL
jgi:hypothetical protein